MKKLLRTLSALSCTAALALGSATAVQAADAKEAPKGSIRPSGEVKPADLPGLAKITFKQALQAALEKSPGSVIKAELEVEDGNLMYSFEVVGADQKITEVEIDAGNGQVLDTEDESAEAGHESKKPDAKD